MAKITGHEYPISKIFSPEFDFVIPPYQRPYAWTTEEAGELLEDVQDFMKRQAGSDAQEPYFLGSIVLIKGESEPGAEVVDGQQRLATLTILLAALVDKLRGEKARALAEYINDPGNIVEGIEAKPRLALRDRDRDFFRQYVQSRGKLAELLERDSASLSDPQRNIQANARLFLSRLSDMSEEEAFELGKFLLNSCYLVAVSTPSRKSAWRVFSVLNNRGLDLLPSDILKSEIIGAIPEEQQGQYTAKWEDVEENLGRDAFNEFFSHVRMIHVRTKLRKTVLEEVQEHLLAREADRRCFIDDVLIPYAEAFQIVNTAEYQSSRYASTVNEILRWLQRIDNVDWIPPAMLYMHKYRDDAARLGRFYQSLERLAASMFIRRCGVNQRIERYGSLISATDQEEDLWAADSPLMLAQDEKKKTVEALDGDIYNTNVRVRTYVMLRLDSFLADRAAVYDHKILTVEHVLPQTVRAGSYWAVTWPEEEKRKEWVHRVGNLVLLSRRKNTQASNLDFAEKKRKYFQSRDRVSSFAITTQVLAQDEWTPDVVKDRQGEMLAKLKEGWGL